VPQASCGGVAKARKLIVVSPQGAKFFDLRVIFSDLPSPAEAGFAKAGNRFLLFGITRYPAKHRP
jgi:hypothetical protein